MAGSDSHQVPTFHFEEDTPSLDPAKKWKLYSSISSLSSIISTDSQSTFAGSANELVKHLRSKLDLMQKETFTRMCNKHLNSRDQITDLFVDFRDGLKLLKLLQKLSNKTVARPAKGSMRIHHIQNLTACVKFLIEHKVYLNKVISLFLPSLPSLTVCKPEAIVKLYLRLLSAQRISQKETRGEHSGWFS